MNKMRVRLWIRKKEKRNLNQNSLATSRTSIGVAELLWKTQLCNLVRCFSPSAHVTLRSFGLISWPRPKMIRSSLEPYLSVWCWIDDISLNCLCTLPFVCSLIRTTVAPMLWYLCGMVFFFILPNKVKLTNRLLADCTDGLFSKNLRCPKSLAVTMSRKPSLLKSTILNPSLFVIPLPL